MTNLYEETGLLGAQGMSALGLEGGVSTHALTAGLDAQLPFAMQMSVSGTVARTGQTGFEASALSVSEAVTSTAFQLTLRKDGVIGRNDAVRVSLIQPLHQERGALEYRTQAVADRETGELGLETQRWALGGDRPLIGEVLYATGLLSGGAELSVFSRVELSGDHFQGFDPELASGLRLSVDF